MGIQCAKVQMVQLTPEVVDKWKHHFLTAELKVQEVAVTESISTLKSHDTKQKTTAPKMF